MFHRVAGNDFEASIDLRKLCSIKPALLLLYFLKSAVVLIHGDIARHKTLLLKGLAPQEFEVALPA